MSLSDNSLILYGGVVLLSGVFTEFMINRFQVKSEEQSKKEKEETPPIHKLQRKQTFIHSRIPKVDDLLLNSSNSLLDEIKYLNSPTCDIEKVNHLSIGLEEDFPNIQSPLLGNSQFRSVFGGEGFLPKDAFVYSGSYVICNWETNAVFGPSQRIESIKRWLKAGPRNNLFFNPTEVKAAIVTCGGLCPGLNVVIRELFMTLHFNYRVKEVYGIKFGYKGFYSYEWQKLNVEGVREIHQEGGTILGSSRGGFNLEKMIDSIIDYGVNQIYCLGGDGTHAGVLELFKEIRRRKLKISVVGIPKTIDNDIPIIDKSFGFDTAVGESLGAINSACVEAHCAEFGVGLVRLMGRHAGFIAMEAVNASRDVNICLIPEFQFELYGPHGMLEYCYQRLISKGNLVIVAAEGAGESLLDYKVGIQEKDASGNVKTEVRRNNKKIIFLKDIGIIIKNELTSYCKAKGMVITLKYIDPTYMIRTTRANPSDRQMCTELSQNAVHGAMAGFSGYTVGHVNNKVCYIPIEELLSGKYLNRVEPEGRAWQRTLASTGQPSFLNDENSFLCKLPKNK